MMSGGFLLGPKSEDKQKEKLLLDGGPRKKNPQEINGKKLCSEYINYSTSELPLFQVHGNKRNKSLSSSNVGEA